MVNKIIYRLRGYAQQHTYVFPLVLLIETLLTYGTMGFFCGFYWDDWPPVLLSNIARPGIFWLSYGDRPFSVWTFMVMFPLLQNHAWAWQLATMVLRWVGVYFFYLVLVNLFPKQRTLFQWASLLAIVMPIFQYQNISVAFSQHFFTYAIFAGSLLCLVMSFKYRRYFWLFYPLSLVMAAAHIFMMEYFVGLEVLRPLVIYLCLKNFSTETDRAKRKTLLFYLPFFFVLIVYLIWRFFVYPSAENVGTTFSNSPFLLYNLVSDPLGTIKTFVTTLLSDLRFTFLSNWLDRLWPANLNLESKVLWVSLFVGALGSVTFLTFFGERREEADRISSSEFFKDLALGFTIYFFGIAPVWITMRQVSVGKFSERFALAAIPGIALIIAAVFWKVISSARLRMVLLSILVALSVSYQVQMGNEMNKDSNVQQVIISQLKWRIPQLKPGTAIYSPSIFSDYEADYSYSMEINLLYDNHLVQPDVNYWFFTPRYHLVDDLLNNPALTLTGGIKGTNYTGTAANMVAVYKNGSGCLLILDPIYSQLSTTVGASFSKYGSLTNFDTISDDGSAGTVFPQAFGKISTNDWCYFFEKADLAKQEKNWDQVISLYQQADQTGYKPLKSVEYIPLIMAQAEKGQISQALVTTKKAITMSDAVVPSACKLWGNILHEHSALSSVQITQALGVGTCQFK
jgi:hypothetical protein